MNSNRITATLTDIVSRLHEARVGFALVGGFAVSARAQPRFTRDIDLAVAVAGDAAAEQLVHGLQRNGYRVMASIEQEYVRRLATIRLVPPHGETEATVVDLLFASSGIEAEIVQAAESIRILPEVELPVATIGHLIGLKILSRDDARRPQDRVDLVALLKAADEAELERTTDALRLITERGYSRNRDLEAELQRILEEVDTPRRQ